MKVVTNVISILLHPLVLPTYLFAVFTSYDNGHIIDHRQRTIFLISIFLMTYLIPLLGVFLFQSFGVVKSVKIEDRLDRIKPFLFTSIVYIGIAIMMNKNHVMRDFGTNLLLIMGGLILWATIITYWWKVSLHSMGWGGAVGIFLWFTILNSGQHFLSNLILSIVLAGLVMACRIHQNAHDTNQVYIGFLLGAIGTFISSSYLLV